MKNISNKHMSYLKFRGLEWLLSLLLIFIPGIAGSQPLSYAIDSASLQILDWEGGHSEFEIADINDDGFNDILSVGDHGSPYINTNQHGISIFFGNGTATGWSLYQEGNFGYGGIAVGDVNNDGYKDVGYGVHHNYNSTDLGDQVLEVVLGNGTGAGWVPYDDSLGMQGQTWGMFGTDFADINNDGLLDIGSNAFGCCDGIHVHLNNGDGTWSYSYGFIGGNSNHVFRFGDFNNDGNYDFAVARQGGTAYFGDGTGNFVKKDSGLPPSGNIGFDYVHVADTDGDATSEIGFCDNGGIFVYKWNETLQQWQNVSGTLPVTGSYYTMNLTDLNNDGFTDVVAFGAATFTAYTGNGSNTWTLATNLTIPNLDFPQAMATGDVDHNGRMEILLLGRFPLSWFTNINKLYLIKETTVATANAITAVTPYQNQCMPNNSVRNITWNSTLVPGTLTMVNIELSTTGAGGLFDTIAVSLPNNGSYQWLVPDSVQSPNCVLRLSLTDTSGTAILASAMSAMFNIGCDSTTSIHTINSTSENMLLFPNPATDLITLQCSVKNDKEQVFSILDITGRNLFRVTLEKNVKHANFSISHLSPGLYFISDTNGVTRGKFIRR